MKYLIHVHEADDSVKKYTGDVWWQDGEYLEKCLQHLQPMTDEAYCNSLLVILNTGARWSYVIDHDIILWLVEWDPGFIVVRFGPDNLIAATAIRSPIPNFGGREATDADWDAYDEDGENHQYNLIFHPWDAQMDPTCRGDYKPANETDAACFEACMKHANAIGHKAVQDNGSDLNGWREKCKATIDQWAGEGVRL